MQAAFTVVVVLLAILYVLSIVWVVPATRIMRGTAWYVWGVVALVPVRGRGGVLPAASAPLLQLDRDEQELEVALKQRQLMQYGECANCGYPVEADFRPVPELPSAQLKNLCRRIAATRLSRLGRCARTAPARSAVNVGRFAAAPQPQAAPRQQSPAAARRVPRNRPNPCRTHEPSDRTARFAFRSASSLLLRACRGCRRRAARETPMHAADRHSGFAGAMR